ncbi:MAG: YggS family pyridoxal phosphate-dependent enzyme [Burkholderiaceae bacterium]
MAMIADNIGTVRTRMNDACLAAGRPVQSVTLLCVSKTAPASAVRQAHLAGECHFGENYVQEGLAKIQDLDDLRARLTWHMIGPIQANKTRPIAEHFDWVHSVDRLKVAQRLSEQRPPGLAPLQVCLQVNVSGESSKAGVAPADLHALARAVNGLAGLSLRGLMSIPGPSSNLAVQRAAHGALRELLEALNREGLALDTLSMGMTADLEAAILEGATLVRVGTAVFGSRS